MSVKAYSKKSNGNTALSANFKVKEFCCNDGSDTILIDSALVEILQKIRSHFNKSVSINSAYRTAAYNAKVGGEKSSYHIKGQAADIVVSGTNVAEVAKYAESIGVLGIGLYSSFVHVDTRATKFYWKNNDSNSVSTFGGAAATTTASTMKTSDTGIEMIKQLEGFEKEAYKDSKGIWTIGYGHTSGVKQGQKITADQAVAFLKADLATAEAAVNSKKMGLNQNQFDALVSFTFNCGAGNLDSLVNGRTLPVIAEKMLLYNKAGGKKLAGLVRRRKAEYDLFKK